MAGYILRRILAVIPVMIIVAVLGVSIYTMFTLISKRWASWQA